MKHLSAILVLLFLAACNGGGDSPKQGKQFERRTTCGGSSEAERACLTPSTYILNTRLSNLSKKLRIDEIVEGQRRNLADSCKNPKGLTIISNQTGSSMFLKGFNIGVVDFTLELMDLGADCKGNTVVIKADLKAEDVRTDSPGTFSIDLD